MHIRLKDRALLPGGGMGQPGQVLDLPEAEAMPLVEAGLAAAWPPAAEAEPAADD
jgi:hypothetical protein